MPITPLRHSPCGDSTRILCFGDSLTEGYTRGGAVFEPYSVAFKTLLKKCGWAVSVVTDGESGDRVTDGSFEWRMKKRCKSFISFCLFTFIMGTVPGVWANSAYLAFSFRHGLLLFPRESLM